MSPRCLRAKIESRGNSNPRVFEKIGRESVAIIGQCATVRVEVKSSFRFRFQHKSELFKFGNEKVSSTSEFYATTFED